MRQKYSSYINYCTIKSIINTNNTKLIHASVQQISEVTSCFNPLTLLQKLLVSCDRFVTTSGEVILV